MEIGWEDGKRVRVTGPEGSAAAPAEGSVTVATQEIPWPNAEDPVLYLSSLTGAMAIKIADTARRDLMMEIAGASLEPMWIVKRTMEAALLYNVVSVMEWPGQKAWEAMMGGDESALAMVGTLFYGRTWKSEHRAAQSRLRGVVSRYDWIADRCELTFLQTMYPTESDQVAILARRRLLSWLMAEASALVIAQRWFSMAWTTCREAVGPLSGEDIGELFGMGRASVHEWISRYLIDPAETITGEVIKVAGMKPAEASPAYAANAAKHKPRQQLRGGHDLTRAEAGSQEQSREDLQKLYCEQKRLEWEQKQRDRDAEEMKARARQVRETGR